jgi:hypothetical protein
MLTVLPLNTVVHITDISGNRYGYGLQVAPSGRKPIQHWILFSEFPPAKYENDPRFLPTETVWAATNDVGWSTADTLGAFLERVGDVIDARETDIHYATVSKTVYTKQPDVGGFQLLQRGRVVGVGEVTYGSHNGYRETWELAPDFAPEEGFGFRYTYRLRRRKARADARRPAKQSRVGSRYPTEYVFAVKYYKNRIP